MWNLLWHELCIRSAVSPLPIVYEVYILVCICAMLCLVAQLCQTLCDPWTVAHQAPLSVGILQARILEWVSLSPLQRTLFNPGIESRSPTLQEDSLLSEPPGKPKNTGVGSLSLLQGIFLTQE